MANQGPTPRINHLASPDLQADEQSPNAGNHQDFGPIVQRLDEWLAALKEGLFIGKADTQDELVRFATTHATIVGADRTIQKLKQFLAEAGPQPDSKVQ